MPLAVFLFVLVASPSLAEVICDPDDASMCAALIFKGERSPLTGQVLTSSLAISLTQKAAGCQARLELSLAKVRGEHQAELGTSAEIHQASLDALVAERDLYKDQALMRVPWYETPMFVASTTSVVVVSLFFSILTALN